MMLSNGMSPTTLVILIICAVFIGSLLTVAIIKFVQVCIRQAKRNKKVTKMDVTFLPIFGGVDNIVSTSRSLNRITIEVVDKKLVDFDTLKNLQVGVLVTGNIIKCSSDAIANELENIKK